MWEHETGTCSWGKAGLEVGELFPFMIILSSPRVASGIPLILAVAGMCVACRDLGRIIPNAENTREVHKQKSWSFLPELVYSNFQFSAFKLPWEIVFLCRVGEAKRDRARRR